ncbi:MAG: hypothetical protein AAFX80_24330 [Cyanobacteria bacterium J06639_18]
MLNKLLKNCKTDGNRVRLRFIRANLGHVETRNFNLAVTQYLEPAATADPQGDVSQPLATLPTVKPYGIAIPTVRSTKC